MNSFPLYFSIVEGKNPVQNENFKILNPVAAVFSALCM